MVEKNDIIKNYNKKEECVTFFLIKERVMGIEPT